MAKNKKTDVSVNSRRPNVAPQPLSKGTTMTIPRNGVQSHADFDLTPLGGWGRRRDAAVLTPGGRHVQKLTGLPASLANLHAAINGLGDIR